MMYRSVASGCVFLSHQTTELVPNGGSIAVTNDNVFRYIQMVANFKLNVEIDAQVRWKSGWFKVHDFLSK